MSGVRFSHKVFGTTIAACGCIYALDELRWYRVVRRSFRAAGVGIYTIGNYKLFWTPENASQIHSKVAKALADCCMENEGLYVKIGQAICSMAAVLPKEYTDNLSRLSDKAKTYDFEVINEIIESELGHGVVTHIDPIPVGSASLAQVHKGVFAQTGQVVAIKVQKPNVSVQASWDLRMYRTIVALIQWSFDIPLLWSVDFTCAHFLAELDFRLEGQNSELAKKQLEALGDVVYVPKVLASSPKVLLTEWVPDTVNISNVKGLMEKKFDCKRIVLDATKIFGHQIFHTGHVHCDPHPGNLLVRSHPTRKNTHQIVLIDHGLYVDLPDALRHDYAKLWVAIPPPTDKQTIEEICIKWGIGSPRLFQSIVQASGDMKSASKDDTKNQEGQAETKTNRAEKSAMIKKHLKQLLQDTSKFPKELILIGRCMNYIRAANWTHGSPIDRVALLANSAREALQEETPVSKNWLLSAASTFLSLRPTSSSYHKDVDVVQ